MPQATSALLMSTQERFQHINIDSDPSEFYLDVSELDTDALHQRTQGPLYEGVMSLGAGRD